MAKKFLSSITLIGLLFLAEGVKLNAQDQTHYDKCIAFCKPPKPDCPKHCGWLKAIGKLNITDVACNNDCTEFTTNCIQMCDKYKASNLQKEPALKSSRSPK